MFVTTSARTGPRHGTRTRRCCTSGAFRSGCACRPARASRASTTGRRARRPKGGPTMGYELMGRIHAAVQRLFADQRGQGTVEYVGLILLVAGLLATIVLATKKMHGTQGISNAIVKHLKSALDSIK